MTEQALQARRAYKRDWAKKNREKARASEERYWERIAANMREENKQAQGMLAEEQQKQKESLQRVCNMIGKDAPQWLKDAAGVDEPPQGESMAYNAMSEEMKECVRQRRENVKRVYEMAGEEMPDWVKECLSFGD